MNSAYVMRFPVWIYEIVITHSRQRYQQQKKTGTAVRFHAALLTSCGTVFHSAQTMSWREHMIRNIDCATRNNVDLHFLTAGINHWVLEGNTVQLISKHRCSPLNSNWVSCSNCVPLRIWTRHPDEACSHQVHNACEKREKLGSCLESVLGVNANFFLRNSPGSNWRLQNLQDESSGRIDTLQFVLWHQQIMAWWQKGKPECNTKHGKHHWTPEGDTWRTFIWSTLQIKGIEKLDNGCQKRPTDAFQCCNIMDGYRCKRALTRFNCLWRLFSSGTHINRWKLNCVVRTSVTSGKRLQLNSSCLVTSFCMVVHTSYFSHFKQRISCWLSVDFYWSEHFSTWHFSWTVSEDNTRARSWKGSSAFHEWWTLFLNLGWRTETTQSSCSELIEGEDTQIECYSVPIKQRNTVKDTLFLMWKTKNRSRIRLSGRIDLDYSAKP